MAPVRFMTWNVHGTFNLNPRKKPKQIDMHRGNAGDRKTTAGIYKIEKDTLTMSWGESRPTDFTSPKKGQNRFLAILKRVAKKKSQPKGN